LMSHIQLSTLTDCSQLKIKFPHQV